MDCRLQLAYKARARMTLASLKRLLPLCALALLAACKPEIGDDCELSTDCSASGDRLCDSTQPGGYCTIFGCDPGGCPEEAVCVAFNSQVSDVAACQDPQGASRFLRSFCMRRCDSDEDCRSGYVCYDMNRDDNAYGAVVVETGADRGAVNGKVCAVPQSGVPLGDYASDAGVSVPATVCNGTDAGEDAWAGPDDDTNGAAGAGSDNADGS